MTINKLLMNSANIILQFKIIFLINQLFLLTLNIRTNTTQMVAIFTMRLCIKASPECVYNIYQEWPT